MSGASYQRKAIAEAKNNDAIAQWFRERTDTLKDAVSAHDVLRRHGVQLKYSTDREEQFACPFHGRDNKPSARVYPSDSKGPSHAWCFVCQERWDIFALWRKFNGIENFSQVIFEMERAYGIVPPERAHVASWDQWEESGPSTMEVFSKLHDVCESRMRYARHAFTMEGFLKLGSLIDQITFRVEQGQITPEDGREKLQLVLDKIGEKVQQCPGD